MRPSSSAVLALLAFSSVACARVAIAQAGNVTIPKESSQPAGQTTSGQPTSGQSTAGKEIDLRPKFKAGDEHLFKLTLRSRTEQAGGGDGGERTERTVDQDLSLRLKVTGTREDGSDLDLVYEAIRLRAKDGALDLDFDSSRPAPSGVPRDGLDIDSLMRPLIGLTLHLKTDTAGRITSVTTSGGGAGAAGGLAGGMLANFTSADVVKQMFGPVLTLASDDGKARVGEAWSNQSAMSGAIGNLRLRTDYVLRSHVNDVAEMGIEGKVLLDSSMAVPVSIKDSAMAGTARWNTKVGMLDSLSMTQRVVAENRMVVPDDPLNDAPGTGSGPETTTQSVTMTVTRQK